MSTIQETKDLAVIENSIEVFKTAPQILQTNQIRTQKAIAVGESILSQWQDAWKLVDENERMSALMSVDERSNKYIVNCNAALKEEKEVRAAITQLMDEFRKMFTATENSIDKNKKDTLPNKIQSYRDTYAATCAEIAEEKRIAAERVAKKAKEAIDVHARIETLLRAEFHDFLLKAKQWLNGQFNSLQLSTVADDAAALRLYSPEYKDKSFEALHVNDVSILGIYHTPAELELMHSEVKKSLYTPFHDKYLSEMGELKNELVDKIHSKFEELTEAKRLADEAEAIAAVAKKAEEERNAAIAKANTEERERLEKEAAVAREQESKRQEELRLVREKANAERQKRETEESEKLARESALAQKKAEEEIELKKQGEQTMIMFEQEAATADINTPDAKSSVEIEVLHPAAYVQIFQFWFEHEGKNLPIDKIGKTKMDQMKSYCEKECKSTGEQIDSKFLKYNIIYKAVNKK